MADESPELIEKEMQSTRQSLTEKVAALENQVMTTIQTAATTVQETVENVRSAITDTTSTVKETVAGSVESVSEGVKEMFDVRSHVKEHPLAAVGVAAAAGFVTGLIVFRKPDTVTVSGTSTSTGYTSAGYSHAPSYAAAPPPPPAPASPGLASREGRPRWLNDLLDMAGEEAKKWGTQALAALSQSVRQNIDQGVPHLVQTLLDKAGGNDPARPAPPNGARYTPGQGYGTGV